MRRFSSVCSIIAASIALLFVGCAKVDRAAPAGAGPAKPAVVSATQGKPVAPAGRSLVTTWTVGMTVNEPSRVASSLRAKTEELGGYVASSNASTDEGTQRGAQLELRVPSDKLAELRASLEGLGDLTTDSETTEDVTEARADVEARLTAARTEEARVLELMHAKTGSIGEVLETEKELARIRENIERLDAERRTLVGRVDFAMVHVSIARFSPSAWSTPGQSIMTAWHDGLHAAKAAAVILAMTMAAVAPFVLPAAAFALLVYFAARRFRQRALV